MKRLAALLLILACVAGGAEARNADGTLKLIRHPLSTRPAMVVAGSTFTLELQHHIDINHVQVELVDGLDVIHLYTSDPRAVFEVEDRSTFDLPSWDCLVDGWKMSWMWRPRVVVHDLVRVPVPVPESTPAGLYSIRVRSSAGTDSSAKAVRVYKEWPEQYTIAHITDPHFGRKDCPDCEDRVMATIEEINKRKPEFVILTGDNSQHNFAEEHVAWISAMDNLEAPVFAVNGNHDMGGMVYEGHSDPLLYIGDPYYSFDFGDHHYTGIDNAGRHFDEEQVAWIHEDLAANQDKALRVIFGHCLYQQSKKDEAWFNNELFPHYNVALHLYGHRHGNFVEKKFDGLTDWICTAQMFDGFYTLVHIEGDRVAGIEQFQSKVPTPAPEEGEAEMSLGMAQ